MKPSKVGVEFWRPQFQKLRFEMRASQTVKGVYESEVGETQVTVWMSFLTRTRSEDPDLKICFRTPPLIRGPKWALDKTRAFMKK